MIELLFLFGFSLHNIEEAIWLPKWSKYARKFHREVNDNEFRFAVVIITAIGYLLTFQYLIFSTDYQISKFIYLVFISMMIINVIFPHLAASIILRRYAPGTATGLLLNAPIGLYIILNGVNNSRELFLLIFSTVFMVIFFLLLINILFKIGKRIFN